jgi:hypothetical protein
MLGEIIDIVTFSIDFISKRKKDSAGWSKIYKLYLSLGDVIEKSEMAINHYLPLPLDTPFLQNSSTFKSPVEKWVAVTNEDFRAVQHAVKEFLDEFRSLAQILEIYDEDLKGKIDFHIKWKSIWYSAFEELYMAGELQSDGKSFRRKWLKLKDKAVEGEKYHLKPKDITEKFLLEELIDISTIEKRDELIHLGKRNIEELKAAKQRLAVFIRENCKIEDLLS